MQRRIIGLENEYGVTCTHRGKRRLSPDEVARYLFRRIVSWGRSSNVFLPNGARLYLDVGSHPEYATPECDSIYDVVCHDRAGEVLLEELVETAEKSLAEEGINGTIYAFKNNTDSAGHSYGCHENYLTTREDDFSGYAEVLIPFLVTRQIYAGAGKVIKIGRGARYCISQRAEHIWDVVSSATTRGRPIINTRDEPHADADLYRRLHVIVGDSNMSDYTAYLKIGSAMLMLRMLEDPGFKMPGMTLENPRLAIRDISHDITCSQKVRLANGKELTAIEMQFEFLELAKRYLEHHESSPQEDQTIAMWEECVLGLQDDPLSLDSKIDWVIKYRLIENYKAKHGIPLHSPQVSLLDLQYHHVHSERGVFALLKKSGRVEQLIADEDVKTAMEFPPQTTRARLRGAFVRAALDRGRDYTVDWVHLKLNDQSQRPLLCKDPFKSHDERVEHLIASL